VLLQMLALTAGVFAMANPRLEHDAPSPVTWLIAVQGTPSMENPGRAGSRFDEAKEAIKEIDRVVQEGDRVVLLVGRMRFEAASGAGAVRELRDLQLTAAPDDGVAVLNEQVGAAGHVLCWIGDRRPERLDNTIPHILVGGSYRNRGIVSTELIQKSDSVVLVAGVWATESESVGLRCDLYRGRWMPAATVRQSIEVEPGRAHFAEFPVPTDSVPYGIRLVLDGEDDFGGDDVRYSVVRGPGKRSVRWVGRAQPDIRKALESLPGVSIVQDAIRPDLVISHREWPDVDAARVIVDPLPGKYGSAVVEDASRLTAPVRWGASSLLQFIHQDQVPRMDSPRSLRWEGDEPVEPLILDANDNVLAMFVDTTPPLLVLGFDPAWTEGRSDWPVRRSFPIFWMNVLNRLTGTEAEGQLRLEHSEQPLPELEVIDGRADHGLMKDVDGSLVAVDGHAGGPDRYVVGRSDRHPEAWSVDRPRDRHLSSLRSWMILLAFLFIGAAWALEHSSD
jgi:hypothetical protein